MKRLLLTGSVLKLLLLLLHSSSLVLLLHSSSSLVKSTKPKANGEVFLTSYTSKACNLILYLSLDVSVSITMHKSYSTSNQAFCKRILNNDINIVGPP